MERENPKKLSLKILEIAIDKVVFGIVVGLVFFFLNSTLETRKMENGVTSKYAQEYLDECNNVWAKITDLEISSEEIVSDFRMSIIGKGEVHDVFADTAIASKMHTIISSRDEVTKYIREKEPILGSDLVPYFLKYVGLQAQLVDAQMDDEKTIHNGTKVWNAEFVKETRDGLRKMRFGIEDAKGIALQKFIRN